MYRDTHTRTSADLLREAAPKLALLTDLLESTYTRYFSALDVPARAARNPQYAREALSNNYAIISAVLATAAALADEVDEMVEAAADLAEDETGCPCCGANED